MSSRRILLILICCFGISSLLVAGNYNTKRPYELEWAERYQEKQKPLIDFEDLSQWKSKNHNSITSFISTQKKMLWGKYVGRLEYKCTGASPVITLTPPAPINIKYPFDCVSMWVYGNNFLGHDRSTPQVKILILLKDSQGQDCEIEICKKIRWKEWFLCHRRLTPSQIKRFANGGQFIGIKILNGYNRAKRVLYFDNLAVFKEKLAPLKFSKRPQRGIKVFANQAQGVNTGKGKLPFPSRQETILPNPGPANWKTTCLRKGSQLQFKYIGKDGTLTAKLDLQKSIISNLKMKWGKQSNWISPAIKGGLFFDKHGKTTVADKVELKGLKIVDNRAYAKFNIYLKNKLIQASACYWLYGKSLVVDLQCPGGEVTDFKFGKVTGLKNPRLIQVPYYVYGKKTRPVVIVSGSKNKPLFFASHLDWTLSNASKLWSENKLGKDFAKCNGGALYFPKNNGVRNDLYERLVFTLTPEFSEVLPNIPNPQSSWRKVTSDKVWLCYASGNRKRNADLFRFIHRLGINKLIVTDHEKQWRVSHEGYTFRTRFAPDKGGNKGQYKYTRVMRDELNYMYGPYNNYTDIVPTNKYWNYDMVTRDKDNQLLFGFVRCYSPKPVRAVEYCEIIPPAIQKEMNFNTAYCDVHTAVPPWRRTDYDARVPGAGTFAGTYYAYGEVMLLQKKAWNGPVYSEGGHHYVYSGLTDGNYAQDQSYFIPQQLPWLVDFDLLKMHRLENNFGMGSIWMFFGRTRLPESKQGFDNAIDRFLAATVAFGHSGYLVMARGFKYTLRSYYMIQQLQKYYNNSEVIEIKYVDAKGRQYCTSKAIANGCYKRSQLIIKYANGCIVGVNGNKKSWMKTTFENKLINLPPNGYIGWTTDGKLLVYSKNNHGRRIDYAVTPDYMFIDGRGKFTRLPKAASDGSAICRILKNGWEIIPYKNSDCGFAVNASTAEALDKNGKLIGPAKLRTSRGLTYVMPVKNAFSYRLYKSGQTQAADLKVKTTKLFPGQSIIIDGVRITAPGELKAGTHWWCKVKNKWIDFDILPICELKTKIIGNKLLCSVKSNLLSKAQMTITTLGRFQKYKVKVSGKFSAEFNLSKVNKETLLKLPVVISSGQLTFKKTLTATATASKGILAVLPIGYEKRGVILSNNKFINDVKKYGATVHAAKRECGGLAKSGLSLRPPRMKTKAGFTYALLKKISLPDLNDLRFLAEIGRYDKCPAKDETVFKLMIKSNEHNKIIGKWNLKNAQWKAIECDLTPWRGKQIEIVLLVGSAKSIAHSYNTFGCWTNMKIISSKNSFLWSLPDIELRFIPSPAPLPKVTRELLRQAKKAWISYEGQDFTDCELELNGVMIGKIKPANGCVWKDIWSSPTSIELQASAITELRLHNQLIIHNPRRDFFKIRNFKLEVEMNDGKRYSSLISASQFTQPGRWRYIAGTGVPFRKNVEISIWFQ
jgi:hypothetical protein